MNKKQLKAVMKFHLSNFNDEGVEINDNTIHNTILSDSDGYGNANSKYIYRAAIRWTLTKNGKEDNPWPENWAELSVSDLAEKLFEDTESKDSLKKSKSTTNSGTIEIKGNKNVTISVVESDVTKFDADVLVLKYAQSHFGLDLVVSRKLVNHGMDEKKFSPEPNNTHFFRTHGIIRPKNILVVGVNQLNEFNYEGIRFFARVALEALSNPIQNEIIEHVCFTLHGAEFGLDETEAFESEIAGLIDGITAGLIPKSLKKISIVEKDDKRAVRLKKILKEQLPQGFVESNIEPYQKKFEEQVSKKIQYAGYSAVGRQHIFVAMPFRDEMEDVYHYGIRNAVTNVGFLCERADLSAFTGDIMNWVKTRIGSAKLVIADLTGANPNVYLEVGYAWAMGVKTVLLVNDPKDLAFDVKSQRCLIYKNIKDLEDKLYKELAALQLN